MTEENGAGPLVVSALPVLIVFALFQTIPLLKESRETNALAFVLSMALALVMGVILHRRMTSVRDHEYHRMRSQRKLGGLFQREDRGMWSSAEIRGPGGTVELGPLGRAALERMDQDVGALVRLRTTDEIPLEDDPPEIEMLVDRIMPTGAGEMALGSDFVPSHSDHENQTSMENGSMLRRFSEWRASRKRRRLERLAMSLGLSMDEIAPQMSSPDSGQPRVSSQLSRISSAKTSSSQPMGGGSCPLCGAIGTISGGSCQRCGSSFDRLG